MKYLSILDVNSEHDWLIHANYYNRLWHQCIDFIHSDAFLDKSEAEKIFYEHEKRLLLNQKVNCQVTALRTAYTKSKIDPNYQHKLTLALDEDERGVNGDGVFYTLYSNNNPNEKCHIPHRDLERHLTQSEKEFFEF